MPKVSRDLVIACKILEFNKANKPIWFGKILEIFNGQYDKYEISNSMDTLSDWCIVFGEYGETEHGRAGYRYYIYQSEIKTLEAIQEVLNSESSKDDH